MSSIAKCQEEFNALGETASSFDFCLKSAILGCCAEERTCASKPATANATFTCDTTFAQVMGSSYVTMQICYITFGVIAMLGYLWRLVVYARRRGLRTRSLQRSFFAQGFIALVTFFVRASDPLCYGGVLPCWFVHMLQALCYTSVFSCVILLVFNWHKVLKLLRHHEGAEDDNQDGNKMKRKTLENRRDFFLLIFWVGSSVAILFEVFDTRRGGLWRGLKLLIGSGTVLVFTWGYVRSAIKILREGAEDIGDDEHAARKVHDLRFRVSCSFVVASVCVVYDVVVGFCLTFGRNSVPGLAISGESANVLPIAQSDAWGLIVVQVPNLIAMSAILIMMRAVWRVSAPASEDTSEQLDNEASRFASGRSGTETSKFAIQEPFSLSVKCREMFYEDPTLCIDRPALFAGYTSTVVLSWRQTDAPGEARKEDVDNPLFAARYAHIKKQMEWRELARTELSKSPHFLCQLIVPAWVASIGQGTLRFEIHRKGWVEEEEEEDIEVSKAGIETQEQEGEGTGSKSLNEDVTGGKVKREDKADSKHKTAAVATVPLHEVLNVLHKFRGDPMEGTAKLDRILVVSKPKGLVAQKASITLSPMMLDPDARSRSVCFARSPAISRCYRLFGELRRPTHRPTQRFVHRDADDGEQYQLFILEQMVESLYTFTIPPMLLELFLQEKTRALTKAGFLVDGSTAPGREVTVDHGTHKRSGSQHKAGGHDVPTLFLKAPCGEPVYHAHIGHGKGLRSPSSSGGMALSLVREDSPVEESSAPVHATEGDSVVATAVDKEEDKKDKKSSRRRKMKHGSSMPPDNISISGYVPVDALVEQLAIDRQRVRDYKEHGNGKSDYYTEHKKTFKPSVDKSDKRVPHIATNLHVHTMYVTGDKDKEKAEQKKRRGEGGHGPVESEGVRYDWVTVGAFAAHTLKFKGHIGIWQREEKLLAKGGKKDKSEQAAARFHIMQRTEVAFSQALTALITSFVVEFTSHTLAGDIEFLEQIAHVGFLFQMESLLSTFKNELGMIGDMSAVISRLNRVSLKLQKAAGEVPGQRLGELTAAEADKFALRIRPNELRNIMLTPKTITRDGDHIVVVLELRNTQWLDRVFLDSSASIYARPIAVTATIFTQGVNEFQSAAQSVGDTSFQAVVNRANLPVLRKYIEAYVKHLEEARGDDTTHQRIRLKRDVESLARLVDSAANSQGKTEGCKLLKEVAAVVRRVNGGRLTCCKSAKDRTSMSVTLEQARILSIKHGYPKHMQKMLLDAMRTKGVRLENSAKNTGHHNYAFNKIQKASLPAEYRPPDVVLGGLVT